MLPEERKLEQGSRHRGGSSGGGVPGFVWVWIILMLLWLIGFFH